MHASSRAAVIAIVWRFIRFLVIGSGIHALEMVRSIESLGGCKGAGGKLVNRDRGSLADKGGIRHRRIIFMLLSIDQHSGDQDMGHSIGLDAMPGTEWQAKWGGEGDQSLRWDIRIL